MGVDEENGRKNYRERIEELRKQYPLGIPAEEVILICQDLEIYYLLQVVKDKTEKNEIAEKFKNYIKFSTN